MSTGPAPEMTVAAALIWMETELAAAGVEEPRREARLLLAAATGWNLARIMAYPECDLGNHAAVLQRFLAERRARKPISRILGEREFYGLPLRLAAATLDPRPDTEVLVDFILATLAEAGRMDDALRLLDLGTGTGAILLALLHHLPQARGVGIDIATEAVAMAAANGERLGLAGRASFRQGDLLAAIEGPFDIIVSNPPYIPTGELAGLAPEVVAHDPVLALDGGEDGLDFYRRLAREAPPLLTGGGWLAVEVGAGQAPAVVALMQEAGLGAVTTRHDLAGIERVVAGCRLSD